jgi:hypothetical protein
VRIRRRGRATAAATVGLAVVALLLGACSNPAGVDGNLVNDWKAMPEAVIPTPPAEACYNQTTDDPGSVTKWPAPVDCATTHTVETAYVGTFAGEEAERSSPPSSGSAGRRAAYEKCAAEAKTYLGEDWRTGRLDLFVVLPIALHWQGGARWYRCDLMEYKDLDDYQVVLRTASLKGALAGDRPVGLGCITVTVNASNQIDRMTPAACDSAHNGEFAGVFELPDGPYPTDRTAASKARLDGCGKVVATYAALPSDASLQDRIGWIATPFNEVEWGLGNRGVRCYAHSADPLNRTIKGAGPSALPID